MKKEKKQKTQMCFIAAISWLMLFGFATISKAESVDIDKAKAVALTQLKKITGSVNLRSASTLDLVYEPKSETNQPYFYVFNGNQGFVIVSGDDRVAPILAYSDEGNFDPNNIPPNMAEFLKGYQREIDFVVKSKISSTDINLKTEWQNLKSGNIGLPETKSKKVAASLLNDVSKRSYTVGDYLVKTNWDQVSPYNALCPYDSIKNERTVVGCVATAMAQIMRYWGTDRGIIPIGQGSNSYVWGNNYNIYADFGNTMYNYAKMPEKINNASAEEKGMVALLSYHCGVASNMNYGTTGSGTLTENGESGFKNYLGFNAKYIKSSHSNFSDTATNDVYKAWKNIIKKEIDELRPIIYVASGELSGNGISEYAVHAWICDGYNDEDFFHMNWGHGGRANQTWCRLTAIMSSGDGFSFIYDHNYQAITHIYPQNMPTNIIYASPTGNGDGSSWQNATSDLYNEMKKERIMPTQIWVKKGIYYGNTSDTVAFTLGNGCNVFGGFAGTEQSLEQRVLNGNNESVLDGENLRKVLGYITEDSSNSVCMDGFTIQNGQDLIGNGGGVYLGLNATIKNCIIKNCTALNGGGIYRDRGAKIVNCIFKNNTATNGGAICYAGYNGNIDSCSFDSNNAINGGAIYINHQESFDTVSLKNCSISFNIAESKGGGIYNTGNLLISHNIEIKNNESKIYGGGVYSSGTIKMISGTIVDNKANTGGGICIQGSGTNYINGGIISNNTAVSGGGIFNYGPRLYLYGSLISNNNAADNGGGVYSHGTLDIPQTSTVKIQSNSAGSCGGGIYSTYGYANIDGGTIGVYTEKCPENKEEALSTGGNYASHGAGVYGGGNEFLGININNPKDVIIGGNYANSNGGGIHLAKSFIIINKDILICSNTANTGGGIFLSASDGTKSSLSECTIKNNKAKNLGGGIYNDSKPLDRPLEIFNAIITNNNANKGGGFYNVGSFNMFGGLISSNTANEGGGIYNQGSKTNTFSISGGEISSNTASNGPGIYNYCGGNYNLSNAAKIFDAIYSYNTVDVLYGSIKPYFNVSGLTYHTDYTKPITIQLWDPSSGSLATLAKYSTSEEATAAVNNGVYVVSNYGWRPVAVGTDVRIEPYTPPVIAKNVIHVTPKGAGLQDGSSWANATSDLYGEMMKNRTDTMQIWVKEGTYCGDTVVGQGGNLAAFILGKRNKVYGGFAGNESSLSARGQNTPSILNGQNSRRVLCQLTDFVDADSSFIDGFTIRNGLDTIVGAANIEIVTGGQSNHNGGTDMTGNGGGVYLKKNGILRNCIIEHCKARSGGGVFNYGGKIINCSFNYNEAAHAGGLFNRGVASLGNCSISNNTTTHSLGYGGGVYNMATLYILDGALINNNKGLVGNGVYTHSVATTTMDGGVISENTGGSYGGGIYNDGIVVMNGGNITNNQSGNGGGITSYGKLTVNAGSISYNTSNSGGGIMSGGDLWINSSSVKIQGNYTGIYGTGGGIYVYRGNAYINGGIIGAHTDNYPESQEEALASGGNVAQIGGGIYVDYGTLTIGSADSIIIGGNYSTTYAGGIYTRSQLKLSSNVFIVGNTCEGSGGGLYSAGAIIELEGCDISYNKAGVSGGGIYQSGNFFIYPGTTISYNEADQDGGGMRVGGSTSIFGGEFSNNKAANRGGAIFNGFLLSFDAYGDIFENKANLGDGIYNWGNSFYIGPCVNIKDIVYIPSSPYAVTINFIPELSFNPITIQGGTGYVVAKGGSLIQSGVDQGFIISTPGFYPVVRNNYVYLYNDGTRSMDLNSATDNENMDIEEIAVYPTLVTSGGMLTVESPDRGTASIWSLSGMMVGQYKVENGKTQIPAPYSCGNYVVKITCNTGKEKVVKIVVK